MKRLDRGSASWWGLWLVVSLALLWPAVINGGAFWFPDTGSYVRRADAVFVTVTGSPSEWSDRLGQVTAGASPGTAAEPATAPASDAPRVAQEKKPVIAGRSIYYGMLLYLPMRWAGPWGAIALQAMLVAAALVFALAVATRKMASHRLRSAAVTAAVLVALTPLPFYTTMLMPDVWSGVGIALLGLVMVYGKRMSAMEKIASWGAVAVMASFHSSHILLAVAVGMAGAFVASGWKRRGGNLALGFAAGAAGLFAGALFGWAVEKQTGQAPLAPPFLSARLSDHGPGIAYLREECAGKLPTDRFALCDYRDRLPEYSDNFLWSVQPENGLFQLAPPAVQRRIAAEDKRFFLTVVAHDPLAYAQSFIASTARTLTSFDMVNFNYYKLRRDAISRSYPPSIAQDALETRAVANTMPTNFTMWATVALSIAALATLAFAFWSAMRRKGIFADKALRYAFVLAVGLLANAVICGALSKPDARYQMRLQWLLPFAAAVVLTGRREIAEPAR